MRTALILPTLGRPYQAAKCVEQLLRTSSADVVLVMPMTEAMTDTWTVQYAHVMDDARVHFAMTQNTLNRRRNGWPDDFEAVIS